MSTQKLIAAKLNNVKNLIVEYKEGYKEGYKEAKAHFLGVLEDKFGPLNSEIKATILRLTEPRLLECAKRLWTAQTLQDVIKPGLTKKGSMV
jgi:hypothetical protein